MKKTILSLAITAMVGFTAQTMANTGTITFEGTVTANTCTPSISGGAASNTVTLPTASAGSLNAAAKTAGETQFTMALSGCTGTLETASAFFEAGTNVNADGRLINTGDAENVDVQLLDGTTGNVIKAGSTEQITDAGYLSVKGGTATLPYTARYYATGVAKAGAVSASVVYNLQYK
ncbi:MULTISPECIES: fimbrial protein [Enterobacteriaceae]|uniref:Fimbrial protein n=1 Tax=Raoultella lignicola TaxID=3040939 RepID=A0ABU9FF08_9ENTR|nr:MULTISPECIES: fimbrial protein [Enterobacteriaceae]MRT47429.1 type 1 fimbrial protein [Raoultella sp. RIT712]QNK09811.1 type 1 fimbrial protein [Enterobacter sp. JUb54]ROS14011.1 major type 1 subunit fimbrin (pilin) [Raoultella sp. BIGb0399]